MTDENPEILHEDPCGYANEKIVQKFKNHRLVHSETDGNNVRIHIYKKKNLARRT
jgi:hypothetical protein